MENVELPPDIWKAAFLLAGGALIWVLSLGIKRFMDRFDSYINKLTEAVQKLITNDAVHDEKFEQHGERITKLEENVFPVKYRK